MTTAGNTVANVKSTALVRLVSRFGSAAKP
jgi:hypothetical protein